jgi:hypothetical protein
VIAGYGTVIVLPTGQLGTLPDYSEFTQGEFVTVDGANTIVSDWQGGGLNGDPVFTLRTEHPTQPYQHVYIAATNDDETQTILFQPNTQDNLHYLYPEADCQGQPLMSDNGLKYNADVGYIVSGQGIGNVLLKSRRSIGTVGTINGPCVNFDEVGFGYVPVPYTLPTEWTNAVYPLRIEQLPL